MCLLTICISSSDKCLFSLLLIFGKGFFVVVVVELYELFVHFGN